MHNGDVLGDEGRKALNACVKVKIYGKPETRRYELKVALERLKRCYACFYPPHRPRAETPWPHEKEEEENSLEYFYYQSRFTVERQLLFGVPFLCDEFAKLFPDGERTCDIVDINEALVNFDERRLVDKYPREGPESDKLRGLIDKRRADVERELEEATADPDGGRKYSLSEAECRVRDCFAGTFPRWARDVDILPTKKDWSGIPKIYRTYDIFDIKESLDYFDSKKFLENYPKEIPGDKYPEGLPFDEMKQLVDTQRADIQSEYELATTNVEIEHGSGFIVHDHFIITNRHVVETCLNKPESHEIRISNEAIGELACKVTHYDAGKDLALLYCPNVKLEQSGICPLQLSSQSLLPGMSVFSFGYPMSHTGETALFVSGNVSGSKKTLAGHSMVVLNCALNSGNSGGPVLCWVKGQLRVVGVATQKHFKEILTLEERETIEKIRKSLQTHAITDHHSTYSTNCKTPMFLLTLKLYDALETHSQFNLSNALPGHLVVDFIKDSVSQYTGEYKEELAEIIKLSEDQVNILPSGHVSTSQCCIQ